MGLSGLLAGGVFLSLIAFLAGIISTVLPMWLIVRTELHNKLCWTGEGLFAFFYTWGVDIPEMKLECSSTTLLTTPHYCHYSMDEDFNSGYTQDYRDAMCKATTSAKITSLASLVFGVLALVLSWFTFLGSQAVAQFARRVTNSPPIQILLNSNPTSTNDDDDEETSSTLSQEESTRPTTTISSESAFDLEFKIALGTTVASFLAFVLQSTTFFSMYASPMFSAEHAYEISKMNAVPFNSSQFGCVFQSPLARVRDITKSSPLKCLFGGPSFALSATSMACWAFAMFFFALVASSVKRLQRFQRLPFPVHTVKHVRHPLLTALLFPRTYSLHGAFSRRFQHLSPWMRRIWVMGLPVLSLMTAIMFAVMMLNNGSAVQVFIRISSPWLKDKGSLESISAKFNLHQRAHQFIRDEGSLEITRIEIIEEVFDFTMLTSISNFWEGKAYALAMLTAVFCAVWPYLRVFIQMIMFFVPIGESNRGRTLTWLDALGKWPFVNLFILCFMGVAFHLNAFIQIPGLIPGRSKDLVDVEVEVILAPRFATYLFVVGGIVSILVSTLFVYAHRKAREWEEERRFAEDEVRRVAQMANNGTVGEPLFRVTDTPYLDGLGRVTPPRGGMIADHFVATMPPVQSVPLPPSPPPTRRITRRQIKYHKGYGYEALCDRHHTPIPGKKYVYTPLAKILVWMMLGFCACTTLAGMLEVSLAFTFKGLVGDHLVDVHDRYRDYSMLSIGTSIETDMGGVPMGTQFLTGMFFITSLIGPILRICSLTLLWFVPMRPSQQKGWFHIIEVCEAWGALDVYFVSTLAATLEIGNLSHTILGSSFPNLEQLVDELDPSSGGLFVVKESLLNGMWLMLTGVLCEKFLSQFIVAQTAITVAERMAEEELALARSPTSLPSTREESDLTQELEEYPETLEALSPAARYTSASGLRGVVYSGLPRWMWAVGIKIGLMVPVDVLLEEGNESQDYFALG